LCNTAVSKKAPAVRKDSTVHTQLTCWLGRLTKHHQVRYFAAQASSDTKLYLGNSREISSRDSSMVLPEHRPASDVLRLLAHVMISGTEEILVRFPIEKDNL